MSLTSQPLERRLLAILLLLWMTIPLHAQQTRDSITVPTKDYSWVDLSPRDALLRVGAPMVAFDLLHYGADGSHRDMALHYSSGYRANADVYAIPIPFLTAWGLHLSGVEGRSKSVLRLAAAHTASTVIAVGITTTTKMLTKRMRPDGSDKRSFPSGHTTYAFASAAALDAEYGGRYPLLSLGGYTLAASVGLSRIAGNRHWLTDVLTGAGVGMGSVYLGYFLSDLILGTSSREHSHNTPWSDGEPWMVSLGYAGVLVPSRLSDFESKHMGFADALSLRIPLRRHWGVIAQANLLHATGETTQERLDLYSLLGGISYFRPWEGSPFAWEGRACMGYLSEGRISTDAYPSVSSSTPHTASAMLAKLSTHLHLRLRPHTALSIDAGYMMAPTAHTYDRKHTGGWKAPFAGMTLSYLFP